MDLKTQEFIAEASHIVGQDELFEGWERCYTHPDSLTTKQSQPIARPVPYSDWTRMSLNNGFNLGSYQQRGRYRHAYAWGITCPEALSALSNLGPLVEIGAGTGWWAMRLRETGSDVIAYDTAPYQNHWCAARWSEVAEGGPEMAARLANRALFLCWPPYADPMAAHAVELHRRFGGTTVALISEGKGGCVGDDNLFQQLECYYVCVAEVDIPQWDGLYDCLTIWRCPLQLTKKGSS